MTLNLSLRWLRQPPQPRSLIVASRERIASVRRNCHAHDSVQMFKALNFITGCDIPQSNGPIQSAGENPQTVRRNGHALNLRCMSGEMPYFLAGRHVPEV